MSDRYMKKVDKKAKYLFFALLYVLLFPSCGSVNMFTRLKRTPREYSLNYCFSDLRAPKSKLNRETWIVFSDRDKNDTYQNPGGKVKMKQMSFMEPFFVIREKGDYLQLVKYDTEIVADNPQARLMKNRKKAKYYGWVHRSNLLLTKQSSHDMATGFKNKAVTIVSDTLAVKEPQLFFDSDSTLAYRDEYLTIINEKMPVHEILYILKSSADRKKILVSRKMQVDPSNVEAEVPGWISASMIKEIGQRLFVDAESLRNTSFGDNLAFNDRQNVDRLKIDANQSREIKSYSDNNPVFRYAPVRSFRTDSAATCFQTGFPAPLINKTFDFVLNLNGNKVMYSDFLKLEENLRKMNLIFVFEGRERVLQEYPRLMSVMQNLQPFFTGEDDSFMYKFGAVLTYRTEDYSGAHQMKTYDLKNDFTGLMDFLTNEMNNMPNYYPIANNQAWSGLNKAVDMMELSPEETYLLVVIGESGYISEKADSLLAQRIAKANGRILGYQMHNDRLSTEDNNFVLQIENMIESYTQYDMDLRRERLVYTSQFKPEVRYRESDRNVYALDPQKTMTQGWILFPAKNQDMQADLLTQAIDSIAMEIRQDNESVIAHLFRAFNEFGVRNGQYTNLWTSFNRKDSLWMINRELLRRMPGGNLAWFMPSTTINMDITDREMNYHLLVSENELKETRHFLEEITQYEPDYKYRGETKKAKRCNCPDDELNTDDTQQNELIVDEHNDPVYINTFFIRRHLYNAFMKRLLNSYKITTTKWWDLKNQLIAQAELEIVGNPTHEKILNRYTVRDIKRKKVMKDAELDALILYFIKKRDALDNYLHREDNVTFESNGETYYWINSDILP